MVGKAQPDAPCNDDGSRSLRESHVPRDRSKDQAETIERSVGAEIAAVAAAAHKSCSL